MFGWTNFHIDNLNRLNELIKNAGESVFPQHFLREMKDRIWCRMKESIQI